MYSPRAFVEHDLGALDVLLTHDPFITLVTAGADGPEVSHVPVLYRRDGDGVLLEGHWARPNPQASGDAAALAIIHGPHAYVSPSWYPDKHTAARVPTWNYAVAHLRGTLQRFEDEAGLADLVDRLSAHFEATVGGDWRFEFEDQRQRTQLRGIVGFRLRPERIEMKFKLNQNHPSANIDAVAAALGGRTEDDARAVAALMRTHAPANKGLE